MGGIWTYLARCWAEQSRSLDTMVEGTLKVYYEAVAMQAGRQVEAAAGDFGSGSEPVQLPGHFILLGLANQ